MAAAAAAIAAVAQLPVAPALAAPAVTTARGSTRAALVHAFVAQDGTSRGITGAYIAGSDGVVCQRTPDAGLIRFLFKGAGSSWRFAFSTRGSSQGSSTQRQLERACR